MKSKKCTKCEQELPLTAYYTDSRTGKPRGRCKECLCDEDRTRYFRNGKEYSASKRRERTLREGYNMSLTDYDDMLDSQQGKCAICGSYPKSKPLAVDHCHHSGVIRGLLCSNCNTALGLFADDGARMEKAIAYLKKGKFNG